jgi:thiol-disulfide isomerase/thioredoxin
MYEKYCLKKCLLICLIVMVYFTLNLFTLEQALASDHPILYLFWGEGCPHCEKEKNFLEKLHTKYPELEMRWFEVRDHYEFSELGNAMRKAYGLQSTSVPVTFIGKWAQIGFLSDETTGEDIKNEVVACIQQECIDAIEMIGPRIIAGIISDEASRKKPGGWELYPATASPRKLDSTQVKEVQQTEASTQQNPSQGSNNSSATQKGDNLRKAGTTSIPLFGKISVDQIGLPAFTFLIAIVDGFNPCTMWVLSFLLSLVIYAKSRSRILLIGGIFVLVCGMIYFLFMAAWLNAFMLFIMAKKYTFMLFDYSVRFSLLMVVRILVSIAAIVMGIINCKDFFFFKKGVSLTISDSSQSKLFKKMRQIIHTAALPGVIFGTIVLAATASFIELPCTAGFPVIYTKVLTLQNFSTPQYYLYLVFYNMVYVIPLLTIISVFAWKMGGRKMTEKEGKILKLIGGALMLVLGILLLVKPEILMFG